MHFEQLRRAADAEGTQLPMFDNELIFPVISSIFALLGIVVGLWGARRIYNRGFQKGFDTGCDWLADWMQKHPGLTCRQALEFFERSAD